MLSPGVDVGAGALGVLGLLGVKPSQTVLETRKHTATIEDTILLILAGLMPINA
jgi:hypothetical protein